jgi:hypothetical protein
MRQRGVREAGDIGNRRRIAGKPHRIAEPLFEHAQRLLAVAPGGFDVAADAP